MNTQLARGLAAVRRRMVGLGVAAGIGWGVAALVVLLLGWMWLDLVLDLGGGVRAAAGVLSVVGGVGWLVAVVVVTLRGATAGALARRLDAVGNTGGQILAGVDLARQSQGDAVSRGLAALAV